MRLVRLALAIGIIALLLRLPGAGQFMTADEQNWMLRSGLFIKNFLAGDIEGTFQGTHPGATAMWLMGTGITLQEWRLGVDITSDNLILFRKAAVLPIVVTTSLLIAAITALLVPLTGWRPALAAGLLLASEPFLVGQSQIAHLDALGALLMLVALLLFAWSLSRRRLLSFVAVGVVVGLALGVKLLLALWLLPSFIGMALLFAWWQRDLRGLPKLLYKLTLVWLIAVVTLALVWPTVLTKADFQLGYISRDTATIITDEHGAYEGVEDFIGPRAFYVRFLLGRLTPLTQLMALGGSGFMLWHLIRQRGRVSKEEQLIFYLVLYSLGFLLMITLVAKKADRYAVPALVALVLVAGWAAARVYQVFSIKYLVSSIGGYLIRATSYILLTAVIALPLVWSPHAIAYSNPLFPNIRPLTQQGWGEGLEVAAAWLNTKPNAQDMYIASWYPSVMRTYFNGKTFSLSSRHDYRAQYVVTYRNMGGRAGDASGSDVLDEVRDKQPVYTVSIHGVPYVWVYQTFSVGNFTRHVGELIGGREIGQTVLAPGDGWNSLELGFATFSSRNNTEDVIVHVRQTPTDTSGLRTVRLNARNIVDNEWQKVTWEPIADSAGQEFYIVVTSPTSTPGNAVTIRYTDADVLPGQLYVNGETKEGDMAYRLPE